MNLSHLHLHVRDRARSEQYYCDWFKLVVSRRSQQLTFLSDSQHFDLALMDDPSPQAVPAWLHFGFRQDTGNEVIALHDAMVDAGIPIIKPLYQDETLVSYRCADPDGYVIEVYWQPLQPGIE